MRVDIDNWGLARTGYGDPLFFVTGIEWPKSGEDIALSHWRIRLKSAFGMIEDIILFNVSLCLP